MARTSSEEFVTLILKDSEHIVRRDELKDYCKKNSLKLGDKIDGCHIQAKRTDGANVDTWEG